MANDYPQAFFAFPSAPASSGDAIRSALATINKGRSVRITSWEDLRATGLFIIDRVLSEIEASDLFLCDLTDINPNVLFELGYAIGRQKRTWIILDTSYDESTRLFDQLRVLTTVGYAPYTHSEHIVKGLNRDAPWDRLDDTIYNSSIAPNVQNAQRPVALYLKSAYENEAGRKLTTLLGDAGVPLAVDDPTEAAIQPLSWYVEKVWNSFAVVCHFTSPERRAARLYNARHALIAGLACALDRPLLMISEAPVFAPLDYRDKLRIYRTSDDAIQFIAPFITDLSATWSRLQSERAGWATQLKLAEDLKALYIGEYVAENEEIRLIEDYFVETSAYLEAKRGQDMIFVGRKGSGKTANLVKLAAELGSDKRNLVCVIKPVAYDLQGVVDLLRRFQQADIKGYVIESLWKYLLLVEVSDRIANELLGRSPGTLRPEEQRFLALWRDNSELFEGDFTVRLERGVSRLLEIEISTQDTKERQQFAISERLHKDVIASLKEAIAATLGGKRRIRILVDNLDKAWDRRSDLELLAHVVLGLLRLAPRLPLEFKKPGQGGPAIEASLAVFVRTDIFDWVHGVAREPDKLKHTRLSWTDHELLVRVVEKRFAASFDGVVDPKVLWARYFHDVTRGQHTKQYIMRRILPRPRDLLYFVRASVSTAVNRGHGKVDESDVLEAERQYSQYAFDSLLAENGMPRASLETILYEFVGCSAKVSRPEVELRLNKAGIEPAEYTKVVERLCALSFLGVEVSPGQFRYAEDSVDFRVVRKRAERLQEGSVDCAQYDVHPAFRAYLAITE